MKKYLLYDASLNGPGTPVLSDGSQKNINVWAGQGATFGGGYVEISISPDNGETWISLPYKNNSTAIEQNTALKLDFIGGDTLIRASLVSSVGAAHIFVTLE